MGFHPLPSACSVLALSDPHSFWGVSPQIQVLQILPTSYQSTHSLYLDFLVTSNTIYVTLNYPWSFQIGFPSRISTLVSALPPIPFSLLPSLHFQSNTKPCPSMAKPERTPHSSPSCASTLPKAVDLSHLGSCSRFWGTPASSLSLHWSQCPHLPSFLPFTALFSSQRSQVLHDLQSFLWSPLHLFRFS